MKIFSKLSFFRRTDINLGERPWHRVFIVSFVFSIIIFFLFSLLIAFNHTPENTFNVNIKYNLQDFTRASSKDMANTIPAFRPIDYKVGCLNGNKIESVSIISLERSVCSPDLRGNIDKVAEIFIQENYLNASAKEQMVNDMTKFLDEDTNAGNCFLNGVNCVPDKIITYKRNAIFYLEVCFFALLATYLMVFILQFLYFKVFLFIIYGKNK